MSMVANTEQEKKEQENSLHKRVAKLRTTIYVYVITWSTVDYTSVTSIIHCRHVITILFHDCDKLWVRSVAAAGENGVGKMLSTCSEYDLQLYRVGHVGGDCCSLYAY